MAVCNINYAGLLINKERITTVPFRRHAPQMYVKKYENFTLLLFKSGKCRLMGCKRPLPTRLLNIDGLNISIVLMPSATACFNVGCNLHLGKLGNFCHYNSIQYLFEPELFPALRLTCFNPLCINVFASGRCTILGLRHLCFQKYIKQIEYLINRCGCKQQQLNNAADQKTVIRKDGFTTVQLYSQQTQGLCKAQGEKGVASIHTTTKKATGKWTKGQKTLPKANKKAEEEDYDDEEESTSMD